ncbi:MFS transporter [Acrocarpospora catenulata]|uniref:MFS transporter n=1 Tax=Acrocarpospora catenulata TaxID=2836182 RepID=UPI001BD9A8DD|nr:MFS transporter [Acrocarpospora catenulata]
MTATPGVAMIGSMSDEPETPSPAPAATHSAAPSAAPSAALSAAAGPEVGPAGETEAVPVPLRRNWRFQALWAGGSAANVGVEAAEVAYPLLILALTGSPALAGLFGFIQVGTVILAGLPAGVLVDRWDRRRVLLAAEITRVVSIGSIAAALYLSAVTVPHLIAVAVVLGAATAFGAPARMLLVRAVVPNTQLTSALSQEEARGAAAALAGPPIGGALFALSRAYPFVTAAIGFLVSLITVAVAAPSNKPAAEGDRAGVWSEAPSVFDGVRYLLGHRTIRAALAMISVFYFSVTAAILVVVVALQLEGASAGTIGLALSGTALGMLAGSVLVPRLHRKLTPGRFLIASSTVMTVAVALLALPYGPVWVCFLLFVAALPLPALRVLVDLLIFRQTPDERRGRAIAATMTIVGVGAPLGSLAGGLALQFTTVAVTVLGLAALQALLTIGGLFDRHLRAARWPAE